MFVDEVTITLKAGHGGPGKVSFFPFMGGPDGGNGGKGGNIFVKGTSDLFALAKYKATPFWKAEDGVMGGSNKKSGRIGNDVTIIVPNGTILTEKTLGEVIEIKNEEPVLVCRGGIGGLGNDALKSARNTTPKKAQGGRPGEEKEFNTVLKLIADFGFIGLPNAGKSSLLNELTNANAKIGNYAFTTVEPNLGVYNKKVIADIPGLIEGASTGKGLGIKFLKHIEKVTLLFHCITSESDDVVRDYEIVRKEMAKFNPELLSKPEIILVTKSDLCDKKTLAKNVKLLKKKNSNVEVVSIHDLDAINKIKAIIDSTSLGSPHEQQPEPSLQA